MASPRFLLFMFLAALFLADFSTGKAIDQQEENEEKTNELDEDGESESEEVTTEGSPEVSSAAEQETPSTSAGKTAGTTAAAAVETTTTTAAETTETTEAATTAEPTTREPEQCNPDPYCEFLHRPPPKKKIDEKFRHK